jgi:hypothetical protein
MYCADTNKYEFALPSNVGAVRNIIKMLSEALKMKHMKRIMDS